jgi:hypothetical protein
MTTRPCRGGTEDELAEMLMGGLSRSEIAVKTGISYSHVAARLAAYTKRTGVALPRVNPATRQLERVGAAETRNTEIVAAYLSACRPTFKELSRHYGISAERVRQIIAIHEGRINKILDRNRLTGERNYRWKPRIEWRCPDCGRERLLESSITVPARCYSCARVAKSLPYAVIEEWIKRRRDGESWASIARSAGYGANAAHSVPRAIYLRLRRNGRLDEVSAIWRGCSVHWLRRRYPDLIEVAA